MNKTIEIAQLLNWDSKNRNFDLAWRAYSVSQFILGTFMGMDWMEKHVMNRVSPNDYLRTAFESDEDAIRHQLRVTALGEFLLNLQNVSGLEERITTLNSGQIEETIAEFSCAKILFCFNIHFRFIKTIGKKRSDYDLEFISHGIKICCETKCKIEKTQLSDQTILDSLKLANDQLPKEFPGVIMVSIPETWIKSEEQMKILDKSIKRFFGQNDRVISIIFHGDDLFFDQNYTGQLLILKEFTNHRNKFKINTEILLEKNLNSNWIRLIDLVTNNNTIESQFQEHFKYHGGIFNLENLHPDTKKIFDYYKNRSESYIESVLKHTGWKKKIPKIHFNFINNPEFNAVASKVSEDLAFVGLNAGTVIIIYDLFFRILSNPNVLKNIGNPIEETKDLPSIRNYYSCANKLVEYGDINYNDYKMSIPNNRIRQIYSRHLIDIAIDFLIAHEVTHIINGHLNYIGQKHNVTYYNENSNFKEEDFLTYQTLEMDADAIATCQVTSNSIRKYLKIIPVHDNRKIFYEDPKNVVFDVAFALSTLNRIQIECFNNKNSIKHPHATVRRTMILNTIEQILKKNILTFTMILSRSTGKQLKNLKFVTT